MKSRLLLRLLHCCATSIAVVLPAAWASPEASSDTPVDASSAADSRSTSVSARPLSLIWDHSLVNADGTCKSLPKNEVMFQLNPAMPTQRLVWTASDKVPLLVLMPERGDDIDSGARLVGAWSYGGKTNELGEKLPWRNGFDVLESLDLNRDGALRGAELNALGLWFDRNQDGKSSGELKRLSALGVTALFYRESGTERDTVKVGYERVKRGREVETGTILALELEDPSVNASQVAHRGWFE